MAEGNGIDWRLAELLLALVGGLMAARFAQRYWRSPYDRSSLVLLIAATLFAPIYLFAPALRLYAGTGLYALALFAITAVGVRLAGGARHRPPAALTDGIFTDDDDRAN